MVGYGLFQTSTLGMRSQAHALNTIGTNIANVNTGGYKRTDTRFETVLSQTLDQHTSDIGGVTPKDYQIIDSQGVLQGSNRDLDVAIVGRGFFQVSPSLTDTTNTFYTRDGSFRTTVESTGEGYLVDKNGYYVLGWSAETDGTFSNTGTVAPLRIDQDAFIGKFTPSTSATLRLNLPSTAAVLTDHASTVLAADQGSNNVNLQTYTIQVVDSNGAKQTARINMTKSGVNQWDVSATTSRASSPPSNTVMLSGTIETGDQYSVTVNGTTETYTALATDTSVGDIRTGLIALLNANAVIAANVTASAGNSAGEITLTANTAATTFTSSAAAVNAAATAQVDTMTITGAAGDIGDQYSVIVDGKTVTYSTTGAEADLAAIRAGIVAAVNADVTVGGLVTAAPGIAAGEITLTAKTAGTAFSASVATPTIVGTLDNTAALVTTTTNATTTNDNAVATGTGTSTQISAISTISFSQQGVLSSTSASTVNLAMTFADGATSTLAVDVSGLTQYASAFLPQSFTHDGLASANMTRVQFDAAGRMVGTFTDSTQRQVYKVPLINFANPDGLEMKNGMVFAETELSGTPTAFAADISGLANFTPNAIELSNVDLASQFSQMIMVQNAYNTNATVFKTVDEMTMVARDLKA